MAIHFQPKSKHPRKPRTTTLDERIERRIEQTARRYNVSKSWVRATALAQYFGIDIPAFDEAEKD
jgi:predicted transcriptional regulator